MNPAHDKKHSSDADAKEDGVDGNDDANQTNDGVQEDANQGVDKKTIQSSGSSNLSKDDDGMLGNLEGVCTLDSGSSHSQSSGETTPVSTELATDIDIVPLADMACDLQCLKEYINETKEKAINENKVLAEKLCEGDEKISLCDTITDDLNELLVLQQEISSYKSLFDSSDFSPPSEVKNKKWTSFVSSVKKFLRQKEKQAKQSVPEAKEIFLKALNCKLVKSNHFHQRIQELEQLIQKEIKLIKQLAKKYADLEGLEDQKHNASGEKIKAVRKVPKKS